MTRSVPIIDLAPFISGAGKATVVQQVKVACESIGFLVVSGHGVPQKTIDAMIAASTQFFALPQEVKSSVKPSEKGVFRGYSELANMSLGKSLGVEAPPDLREGFSINRVDKNDPYYTRTDFGKIFADNVWPDDSVAPGFRMAFTNYYREMQRLAGDLMQIFALALGLPEDYFEDKVDKHFSNMAAYHYPPMVAPPRPGQLRGGAHTDFGSLTLVYGQPSIKGLQVWNGTEWEDVPEVPGTFVVNLGDLMQQWTNDLWRSTMHRVANPVESEWHQSRFSLIFFHQPNYDLVIESLDRDNPAKYAPITSGEHLVRKLTAMRTAA
jgi:isopenicillin N synthase-like dioxygenase